MTPHLPFSFHCPSCHSCIEEWSWSFCVVWSWGVHSYLWVDLCTTTWFLHSKVIERLKECKVCLVNTSLQCGCCYSSFLFTFLYQPDFTLLLNSFPEKKKKTLKLLILDHRYLHILICLISLIFKRIEKLNPHVWHDFFFFFFLTCINLLASV